MSRSSAPIRYGHDPEVVRGNVRALSEVMPYPNACGVALNRARACWAMEYPGADLPPHLRRRTDGDLAVGSYEVSAADHDAPLVRARSAEAAHRASRRAALIDAPVEVVEAEVAAPVERPRPRISVTSFGGTVVIRPIDRLGRDHQAYARASRPARYDRSVDALVGPVDEGAGIVARLRASGFEVDASPSLLHANAAAGEASSTVRRRVILSYGLGVDSTAILLRWLREPESRSVDGVPFDLADLTVITAMVGDEWMDSKEAVEEHVLPLMRAAGVRYVQVARRGHSESEGIEVLDDSTSPTQLHVDGSYRLSTELFEAGTIPTSGGLRKCSLKFKGWVLDTFLQRDLAGAPYVHVIGFEADELKRVEKDQCYGGVGSRTASYPLVEWGWDRAACLAYIREATGVDWGKSACTFCPFSQGRGEVLARYRANPEAAAVVLLMEANALALNPRMKLFSRRSMHEVMRREGNLGALRAFQALLDASEWAVYHIRRAFRSVSIADRSVERLAVAQSRADAEALLATRGPVVREGEHGFAYVHVTAKGASFPSTEEYYVVGPALTKPKTEKAFAKSWAKASAADVARGRRQLAVVG